MFRGPLKPPPLPQCPSEFPHRAKDQIAIRFTEALLRNPEVLRKYTPEVVAEAAYQTVRELEKASNAS